MTKEVYTMKNPATYSINEMLADYHMDAIARDFILYRITPMSDLATDEAPGFHQNPVLDFPIRELHALSSAYDNKGKCLVLFAKEDAKGKEQEMEESFACAYPYYHIQKLYLETLASPKARDREFGYQGYLLCRLLLASVCNYKSPELRCHNVLGQIYIPTKTKNEEQVCLHIAVMKNMTLQLQTTTFRKIDFSKKTLPKRPYYYIGKNSMLVYTQDLRDAAKRDRPHLYIKHGLAFYHNTIDFLNLKTQASFHDTKIGVFTRFMNMALKRLAPYLSISFQQYRFQPFVKPSILQIQLPETASWQAVDMIQEGTSKEDLEGFCKRVQAEYPEYTITLADTIHPETQTLLLFHQKKYYKQKKLPDPSLPYRADLYTHMIACENLEPFFTPPRKDAKPPIAHVLPRLQAEFRIKEDIRNRRFTLFHPADYIHSPWTYVSFDYQSDPEDSSCKIYHFYALRMTPDSDAMEFRYFNETSPDLSYPERVIADITRAFYHPDGHTTSIRTGYTETLDGFFFTDETADHPYLILRSGNFLLPDCRHIPFADPKYEIQKQAFWDALASEIKQADDAEYRQELEQWGRAIRENEQNEHPLTYSLGFLKQAFGTTTPIRPPKNSNSKKTSKPRESRGMTRTLGKKLNAFIGRVADDHYFFTTRSDDDLSARGLDGHLLGRFAILPRPVFREGTRVEVRDAVAYVAGSTLGASYKISRASVLRMILSSEPDTLLPDSLQQEYFAQLMVDHIRTSSYTVRPFPFKYLREFSRYYNAMHQIAVDELPDDEEEEDDTETQETPSKEVWEELSLF